MSDADLLTLVKVAVAVIVIVAGVIVVNRITERGYMLSFRGHSIELEMRPSQLAQTAPGPNAPPNAEGGSQGR